MSVTNKPAIEAYIGATGSGKGVSINRRLAELAPRRLVIWDPRNEYGKHATAVHNVGDLARVLHAAGAGAVRVRYVWAGGLVKVADAFAGVCAAAFHTPGCVFIVDELGDVTTPSWAPPEWRRVITQGRHQGLTVLGAAQRPALIDKNFLGNCTMVRCFQLGYEDDEKAMAKALRVSPDVIARLITRDIEPEGSGADIEALEYHRRTRELYAISIKVRPNGVREKKAPFVVGTPQPATPARARRAAPT